MKGGTNMLDKINNLILYKLEAVDFKLATIYWKYVGRHIKP